MQTLSGIIPYERMVNLPRFQTKSGECTIDLRHIVYLSAQGNYTAFHLQSGECVITSLSLSTYAPLLEIKGFIRIYKSYLLNLMYLGQCRIQRFEGLTLPTGQTIAIARRRRTMLKKAVKQIAVSVSSSGQCCN